MSNLGYETVYSAYLRALNDEYELGVKSDTESWTEDEFMNQYEQFKKKYEGKVQFTDEGIEPISESGLEDITNLTGEFQIGEVVYKVDDDRIYSIALETYETLQDFTNLEVNEEAGIFVSDIVSYGSETVSNTRTVNYDREWACTSRLFNNRDKRNKVRFNVQAWNLSQQRIFGGWVASCQTRYFARNIPQKRRFGIWISDRRHVGLQIDDRGNGISRSCDFRQQRNGSWVTCGSNALNDVANLPLRCEKTGELRYEYPVQFELILPGADFSCFESTRYESHNFETTFDLLVRGTNRLGDCQGIDGVCNIRARIQ